MSNYKIYIKVFYFFRKGMRYLESQFGHSISFFFARRNKIVHKTILFSIPFSESYGLSNMKLYSELKSCL